MKTLLALFIAVTAHAWNTPTSVYTGNKYTPWTWTGAAHDNNWSTGGNWCGTYLNGVCQGQTGAPTAGAVAVFNDVCSGTDCNVTTLPAIVSVAGIQMQSTYSGTISQNATNLTAGNFYQAGGTWTATTGTITFNGSLGYFTLDGGFFNAGAGAFTTGTVGGQFTTSLNAGTMTATSGTWLAQDSTFRILSATFNHHNGAFKVVPGGSAVNFNSNTAVFYAVQLQGVSQQINLFSPLLVESDLTLTCTSPGNLTLNGSSITVRHGSVYRTGYNVKGTTIVTFAGDGTGTAQQVLDMSGVVAGANNTFPGIAVQQTSASASVKFIGDIVVTGGLTANAATNSGGIFLNGANFDLGYTSGTPTYDSDLITWPTLTVSAQPAATAIGKIIVSGDLKFTYDAGAYGSTSGGSFFVGGNVDATSGSYGGYGGPTITLNGAGTQVVNTGGSTYNTVPGLVINKSTGAVELRNSVNGIVKISNDFNTKAGSLAVSNLTMPTVTDLYVFAQNAFLTSNGYAFPATVTIHPLCNSSGGLTYASDDIAILGNFQFDTTNDCLFKSPTTTQNINLSGNLIYASGAVGYGSNIASRPVSIRLVGSGQTINATAAAATAYMPNLIIASTGGTTTLTSGTKTVRMSQFTFVSGTFDATAAKVAFNNSSATETSYPGTAQFGDVTFVNNAVHTINTGETLTVKGALNITPAGITSLNGNIDVYGDYLSSTHTMNGTATVNLKGSNSNFSSSLAIPTGTITIAKTAGQYVTMLASKALAAGQSVNITSGGLKLNGFSLTLSGAGTLTLAAGTTVTLGGGTLTVNGAVVPAGPYSGGTILP